MTKARKVDILYKRAHGQHVDITAEEKRELRKYKIDASDADIATRGNITSYVNQVDKGYRLSFYDYCCNNLKGDRRRKSGSKEAIAFRNSERSGGAVFIGWLFWGMAIYWLNNETIPVGTCAIYGAVISFILSKCSRRYMGFTVVLLPIILMVLAFKAQ